MTLCLKIAAAVAVVAISTPASANGFHRSGKLSGPASPTYLPRGKIAAGEPQRMGGLQVLHAPIGTTQSFARVPRNMFRR